jgi:hypothetical protein
LRPFSSGKSQPLLLRLLLYNCLHNDKIPLGVSELTRRGCVALAGTRFPALTPNRSPKLPRCTLFVLISEQDRKNSVLFNT